MEKYAIAVIIFNKKLQCQFCYSSFCEKIQEDRTSTSYLCRSCNKIFIIWKTDKLEDIKKEKGGDANKKQG